MAVIQRFGGALNLNVHVHVLVLDGVFARDSAGAAAFHPTSPLSALDVAEVLATIEPRIRGLLDRRGCGERDEASAPDAWEDASPVLAGLGGRLRPGDSGDGAPAGRDATPGTGSGRT